MSKNTYENYIKSYSFKDLENKLNTYGIWEVKGEDENCDFGGTHYQKTIGHFEGVLEDVIRYAVTLKGFWTWGSGGSFKQIEIVKVDKDTSKEMIKLLEEKEALETRLEQLKRIIK